uniref:AlNc14C93G5769 protein n=1 Tax=Albugo laibachii Nc14 TaxID=890382 RepID=F0WGP2_9STRA|nr:AlNc14C93G5769 [Albugo laibachii Nc14]|eukprot:CCA20406.1 AlNc14C93G5769 [Albugo laibachii Nc14]
MATMYFRRCKVSRRTDYKETENLAKFYLDSKALISHCRYQKQPIFQKPTCKIKGHAPSSLDTSVYYQHTTEDKIDSQYDSKWPSSSRTEAFEERLLNENIGFDKARVAAQALALKEIEDAAIRMAVAAMKLFEKEKDPELQVPAVPRQATLSKMTEMHLLKFQRKVCSS